MSDTTNYGGQSMETTRTTPASGEVHSHLSSQPDKGSGDSGKYDLEEAKGAAGERFGEMKDRVQGRAEELRGRAEELASQARGKAGELFERAESTIEGRTGAFTRAGENPLAALGIAFGVGFLLAGSGDSKGTVGKAKNQIKGAVMGGLSAAISQQLRSYIEEQGGIGGIVSTFTGQGGQSSGETGASGSGGEAAGSTGGSFGATGL